MNRTRLNALVDLSAFFAFLISLISGIVLWLVLPEGYRGGRGAAELFLGVTRHQWTNIHTVSSLAMAGIIVIHLILHWSWIKSLSKILKR
ncbi:MAG: DUF4405 domain-containing protein [Euryarchaeota archaeon]|nr:DUF4405 domain-containing protein [Euryarchaeota archaeon]